MCCFIINRPDQIPSLQMSKNLQGGYMKKTDAINNPTPPPNSSSGDLPPELAQPARRALANAGILRLDQLTRLSEDEVSRLHGIGPNALRQLRRAL
jgi:hypothetical protein